MRSMLALIALVVIGAASAAYATDPARDGTKSATELANPVAQIKANIDRLGYDIERMKEEGGAYKMRLIDRASGEKVNADFDAKTGELMRAKLAREDGKSEGRDEGRGWAENREHKERDDRRGKGRENRD